MFTIDAHLDLATNAINLNRDLRLPVLLAVIEVMRLPVIEEE